MMTAAAPVVLAFVLFLAQSSADDGSMAQFSADDDNTLLKREGGPECAPDQWICPDQDEIVCANNCDGQVDCENGIDESPDICDFRRSVPGLYKLHVCGENYMLKCNIYNKIDIKQCQESNPLPW